MKKVKVELGRSFWHFTYFFLSWETWFMIMALGCSGAGLFINPAFFAFHLLFILFK
jgi:hypothetical protein